MEERKQGRHCFGIHFLFGNLFFMLDTILLSMCRVTMQ